MDKKKLSYLPVVFDKSVSKEKKAFEQIMNDVQPIIVDTFETQIVELFSLCFPHLKEDKEQQEQFVDEYLKGINGKGVWVYYPWKNTMVHILQKTDFFLVRTGRNNPLISPAEQQALYQQTIAIAGLSVGNSVIMSLAFSGIGNHYKLADFDTLELSNLNRVKASLSDLGIPKVIITARAIAEIDPYCTINIFEDGLTAKNFEEFFLGEEKIDILFDECDSLELKFFLRLAARSLGIPLFMATDNGYQSEVSIVPFDQNKDAGNMSQVPFVEFSDVLAGLKHCEPLQLDEREKVLLISELLGVENISDEMKHALMEKHDKRIVSYPQLGAIAFVGGGLSVLAVLAKYRHKENFREKTAFHFMDHLAPPLEEHKIQRSVRHKKFLETFFLFLLTFQLLA